MKGILFYIAFQCSLLSEKWGSQKNYASISHASFILFLWVGVCATESRINSPWFCSVLTPACVMLNKVIVVPPVTYP